ncbi:hypothetical protein P3T76_014342 [Phytophthora citrophthora]|uniref:TATA element modulatory factor 1 TATA binding domain-containing protein n=1 Tax=Phytophthora citrophthora TaxID=4793 RepID=A0AAD9G1E3_9STRA|nr:hypothetical protein P3T76_014342 [Phytophthora citrophthora]
MGGLEGVQSLLPDFINPAYLTAIASTLSNLTIHQRFRESRCQADSAVLRIFLFFDNPDVEHFLSLSGASVGTLQYLESRRTSFVIPHQDEFRKFHLQPICVQERALPMESNTAFLSAFRSRSSRQRKRAKHGEGPSVLPFVDSFVLADIFAFAAESVKRPDSDLHIHAFGRSVTFACSHRALLESGETQREQTQLELAKLQKHQVVLLELFGEKEEQVEELQAEVSELKAFYRKQLDTLASHNEQQEKMREEQQH